MGAKLPGIPCVTIGEMVILAVVGFVLANTPPPPEIRLSSHELEVLDIVVEECPTWQDFDDGRFTKGFEKKWARVEAVMRKLRHEETKTLRAVTVGLQELDNTDSPIFKRYLRRRHIEDDPGSIAYRQFE